MTPSQWIENMGAGWNLGNCYEHNWLVKYNKARYWLCNGKWNYKINDGSYTSITVMKEGPVKQGTDNLQTFSISFTPTENAVNISIKHPVLNSTNVTLPILIKSATVAGATATPLFDTLTFPEFVDNVSTLSLDVSTLFSESVIDKAVVLKCQVKTSDVEQFPTDDQTKLSNIRKYIISRAIGVAGFTDFNEAVAKTLAYAGFKSVRMQISWMGHCDELDDLGNVHVDTEFLDHLSQSLNCCHQYGLQAYINTCGDEPMESYGWLQTDTYLNDPTVPVRYKSIWTQVANYFKDYGDWLAFASNNEERNSEGWWDSWTNADIYGLMKMQKDFHDVVRATGGNNATRILIYGTYAGKPNALTATYENPNDTTDTGVWGLPDNDEYGIAEVHPYSSTLSTIQSFNKLVRRKGLPTILSEFGTSNSVYNSNKEQCKLMSYTVGYARYFGIGAMIWDDGGDMRVLSRSACTMNNYDSPSLWAGNRFNFIPNLIANANLKEAEILLNNRRQSCYSGDVVSIYLDTNEDVIISNEGSSNVALSGNSFTAGREDITDLLAISYDGLYGLMDVSVDVPEHWNETVYDETANWQHRRYSIFKADGYHYDYKTSFWALELDVPAEDKRYVEVTVNNTTNGKKMWLIEYNSSNQILRDTIPMVNSSSEPYALHPQCTKLVAMFSSTGEWSAVAPIADLNTGTWVKINARDFSQTEEKDLTDSYVDSIMDYSNFNASLHRTIDVSGGMEYQLDLGEIDCNVYIREFNGEKVEAEYWLENGDTFTTNLFTKTMRIEIEVPNANINGVVTAMNNGALRPTLSYTDYATHQSEYDEEFTPIPLADMTNRVIGVGNRLLSINGKVIKI